MDPPPVRSNALDEVIVLMRTEQTKWRILYLPLRRHRRSNQEEILEQVQEFVTIFVKQFETKLHLCSLVLMGDAKPKEGEISKTFSGAIGHGVGNALGSLVYFCPIIPDEAKRGIVQMAGSGGERIGQFVGSKQDENFRMTKLTALAELIDLYQNNKVELRDRLIDAGMDIFQSYEPQLTGSTMEYGSKIGRQSAYTEIARDATYRAFDHFGNNKGEAISKAVVLGRSKTSWKKGFRRNGSKIHYKHKEKTSEWFTGSLFKKPGIVRFNDDGKRTYYKRKESRPNKYFYRRLLHSESWDTEKKHYKIDETGNKNEEFSKYEYKFNPDADLRLDIKNKILTGLNKESVDLKSMNENIEEVKTILLGMSENTVEEGKKKEWLTFIKTHEQALDDFREQFMKEMISHIDRTLLNNVMVASSNKLAWNVQQPEAHLFLRDEDLSDLHNMIIRNKGVEQSEILIPMQMTVITGLDGSGKTQLARKYAQRYHNEFDGIIWINASTYNSMCESFKKVARELGIRVEEELGGKKQKRMTHEIVKDVYAFYRNKKYLFIFANAEKYYKQRENDRGIDRFLPLTIEPLQNKPYFLLTSNVNNWDIKGGVFELKSLDFENSCKLIKEKLRNTNFDNSDVENLATALENFPLALLQAVYYINENGITISKYLELFRSKPALVLDTEVPGAGSKTVYRTWNIIIDQIKENNQFAVKILRLSAYLQSDNIPRELFQSDDSIEFTKSIQILTNYWLIENEPDTGSFNISQLGQKVIRLVFKELEQESFKELLNLFVEILKRGNVSEPVLRQAMHTWETASVSDHRTLLANDLGDLATCMMNHLPSPNTKLSALHLAVKYNALNVVQYLTEIQGVDVNAFDGFGRSPLHIATLSGNVRMVKYLIDHEASIFISDAYDRTPLYRAIQVDEREIVKALLDREITYQPKNKGFSILHNAATNEWSFLKYLQTFQNFKSDSFDTILWLHKVIREGNISFVKFLIDSPNSVSIQSLLNGDSLLHNAVASDNKGVVSFILDQFKKIGMLSLILNSQDLQGDTPLMWAAQRNRLNSLDVLLNEKFAKDLNINQQNKNGETALHWAAKEGHYEAVKKLVSDPNIKLDIRTNSQLTPLQLAKGISSDIEKLLKNPPGTGNSGEEREIKDIVRDLSEFTSKIKDFGLKKKFRLCKPQRRLTMRDIGHCFETESDGEYPYDPLEISTYSKHEVRYSQIMMAIVFEHKSHFQGDVSTLLDTILTYNANIGSISKESELNRSSRERRILKQHFSKARTFFEKYPLDSILTLKKNSDEIFQARANHQSFLFDNGQSHVLMLRDGDAFQLYCPDFNYRYRFATRSGVGFNEMEELIDTYFKWRSGSIQYRTYTLSNSLPASLISKVHKSPLWFPDKVRPDSVLMANDHMGLIESLPADVVRKLFYVDGHTPDLAALHPDFFQQNLNAVTLRVNVLHKVLPFLSSEQIQIISYLASKYYWPADESYLTSLPDDQKHLLESYQGRAVKELREGTITLKRLSELSWQMLEEELHRHKFIPSEMQENVLTNAKEIYHSAGKLNWMKSMGTQTIFFLPDIIRTINTGDKKSLENNLSMIASDATFNHLYENLISHLSEILPEETVGILSKLPVTSPIFKFLTIHAIVELTITLVKLPSNSKQRSVIEHELGEQVFTLGLMISDILGAPTTVFWIGLALEQLIFNAKTFKKQNQLDISIWESMLMILGFETNKLEQIMEEKHIVEFNLSLLNAITRKLIVPYSYSIVKIPNLELVKWKNTDQGNVPQDVRKKVPNAVRTYTPMSTSKQIFELDSYRYVREYQLILLPGPRTSISVAGKLLKSYWQKGTIKARPQNVQVEFSNQSVKSVEGFHDENSVFQNQFEGSNSNFKRIPSVVDGKILHGINPVRIETFGIAVYNDDQVSPKNRNVFIIFDPQEGDTKLHFTTEGLDQLKKLCTIGNAGVNVSSRVDGSEFAVVTIQVANKPYPGSIEFTTNEVGTFTLSDSSQLIASQYFINSDVDYAINDSSGVTSITLTPPQNTTDIHMSRNCRTMTNRPGGIELNNWPFNCSHFNEKRWSDRPVNIGIINLAKNKTFLNLFLPGYVVDGHLELNANQLDALEVSGRVPGISTLSLESVTKFNVTLRSNIQISTNSTLLSMSGDIPLTEPAVSYSKTARNKYVSFHLLKINALVPVFESLSRVVSGVKNSFDLRFSTTGVRFHWQNESPRTNLLQIEGVLDGMSAFVNVGPDEETLRILDENGTLSRVEVNHRDNKATIDSGSYLTSVFSSDSSEEVSRVSHMINDGDTLVIESPESYEIHHLFPSSHIEVNGISYVINGNYTCAVNAAGGIIDGRSMLRSVSAQRKEFERIPKIGLCFDENLEDSLISNNAGDLVVNGLTMTNMDDSTRVVFGDDQVLSMKILKDSLIEKHRTPRMTSQDHLASSTASAKTAAMNDVFNWVTFQSKLLVSNIFNSANQMGVNFISSFSNKAQNDGNFSENVSITSHVDVGLSVVFIDYLIRMFTKVRPITFERESSSLLNAQATVLNITERFEKVVEKISKEFKYSKDAFGFNPVAVQSAILATVSNHDYCKIFKILLDSLDLTCLSVGKEKFLRNLEDEVYKSLTTVFDYSEFELDSVEYFSSAKLCDTEEI